MALQNLSGQAAADYLQKNPNAKYRILSAPKGLNPASLQTQGATQQVADQNQGIGGFVNNIAKSFTALPRTLVSTLPGQQAQVDPYVGGTGGISNSYLDPLEKLRQKADPLGFGLQSAAQTASFLPLGGSPIVAGVIGGTLNNLGTQDARENLNIGEALGSGVLGGAIGLGGQVIGKAGSKLLNKVKGSSQVVDDIAKAPVNEIDDVLNKINQADQLNTQPVKGLAKVGDRFGRKNVAALAEDAGSPAIKDTQQREVLNLLKSFDKNIGTKTKIATGAREVNDRIRSALTPVLEKSGVKFGTEPLILKITNATKFNPKVLQLPQVQKYVKMLGAEGLETSASTVNKIKFEIQEQLSKVYDKASVGDASMTQAQEGLKAIRDVLDESLKTHPNLTQYRPLLEKSSLLNSVQEGLNKSADKGGTKVGAYGIRGDIGGITERVNSGIYKLTGAGKMPQTVSLPTIAGKKGLQLPLAASVLSGNKSGPTTSTSENKSSSGSGAINQLQFVPSASTPQGLSYPQALAKAAQITGGKITSLTVALAAKLQEDSGGVNGGGRTITATAARDIGDVTSGLDQLKGLQSTFEANKEIFDPIKGTLRKLNPYDTGVQSADAIIKSVKQIIGKGLEGGVLRKEDEAKYADILPGISDTPDLVQNKLDNLTQLLANKYNNLIQSYEQAGYNVSNYGSIQ